MLPGLGNPFWTLARRRVARRGEPLGWWGPLVCVAALLAVWRFAAAIESDWPFRHRWPDGRWHLLLWAHAAAISLLVAPSAWRAFADLADPGNLVDLRLTRLRPLELVLGKLAQPLEAGLRTLVVGLPVYLLLRPHVGAEAPPLSGIAAVLGLHLVWSVALLAAAGCAAVRMRLATIDDWGDVVFNARTLVALFLNPFWVLVATFVVMRSGPRLAAELAGPRDWFGLPVTPWLIALPLCAWAYRQALGLATQAQGESPGLALRVVVGWTLALVLFALHQIGHAWTPWLSSGALANWWESPATPEATAQLLLWFLLLGCFPLGVAWAYAEALRSGLRGTDRRDPATPPTRALLSFAAAAPGAGLVAVAVWWLSARLGGWPSDLAAGPWLVRAALLWCSATLATCGYLAALLLLTRLPRLVGELSTIAVLVPALVGPFVLGIEHPAARLLAACSPVTALLWIAPTAGTPVGLTSDIPLPVGWAMVAGVQTGLGVVTLLACALALRRLARGGAAPREEKPSTWWRRLANPVTGLDLLSLQRHGALWTPFGMVLLPLLALTFIRSGSLAAEMVYDICSLFVWHRPLGPVLYYEPAAGASVVILATLGGQLLLHPPGLAGTRSFARDAATGRLAGLLATPLPVRSIVRGRYAALVAPFGLFVLVSAPLALVHGALVPGMWPVAVGGVLHWLGLLLVVPAVALARTVDHEWRGQGLLEVGLLELARLVIGRLLLEPVGIEWGVPLAGAGFLLVSCLGAKYALQRCERRLAALGETP